MVTTAPDRNKQSAPWVMGRSRSRLWTSCQGVLVKTGSVGIDKVKRAKCLA